MKFNLLFIITVCISFISCEPVSYVRLVKDMVKGTETYLWTTTKYSSSALKRSHNRFDLEFTKSNTNPEVVDIILTTNLNPQDAELSNEVYFLYGTQKIKYDMTNLKSTQINENRLTNENYTTYQTVTKQVPVTKTESKIVNNEVVTETKTEMQSVNEQVPVQNTRQISTHVNYTASKNKMTIPIDDLKSFVSQPQYYIRIYNTENDFWTIQFNQYNSRDLKNFIHGIVAPHNIRVN